MRGLLIGILALASAPAPLFAGTPAGNYDYEQCTQDRQCRKASDPELDGIRGGFSIDTPAGRLEIAIGITRAVAVNDQLVAVSQLVLPDVSQIIAAARAQAEVAKASGTAAGQAAAAAAAQAAAQAIANAAASRNSAALAAQQAAMSSSSEGNGSSAQASANPSAQASGQQGAAGQGAAGQGSTAMPAAPQVIVNGVPVSSGGPVSNLGGTLIVQNGPGNVAPLPASFNGVVLPTIVQNSLNEQVLKTLTLINASVSSLSAFKALALSEALSRATLSSGR